MDPLLNVELENLFELKLKVLAKDHDQREKMQRRIRKDVVLQSIEFRFLNELSHLGKLRHLEVPCTFCIRGNLI